jgi:hypothetical protein
MYGRDITYGTASEFGFDYLRDNGMATRQEDQVQRDHWFCIVDEIHALDNKRGVYLCLTLERLNEVSLINSLRIQLSWGI